MRPYNFDRSFNITHRFVLGLILFSFVCLVVFYGSLIYFASTTSTDDIGRGIGRFVAAIEEGKNEKR